jgi:hypothetical protein
VREISELGDLRALSQVISPGGVGMNEGIGMSEDDPKGSRNE